MRIVRLKEQGGQQLHDRFILTDLGCISFSHGLDVTQDNRKTKVLLSLIDENPSLDLWNQDESRSREFSREQEVHIQGRMLTYRVVITRLIQVIFAS